VLAATPGFESYTWMNTVTTRPSFTVYGPGIYSLRVSNNCGTRTDNVEVYQECDFPVYMPTAFTPNNDGLNDVYRVPPENRNHLVSLDIYNRWGQLIFSGSNINVGWDGTLKGIPQASDVFVYKLRMRGLTGKDFRTSGRFTLIR
jgi:gliding motility-associated-like protein